MAKEKIEIPIVACDLQRKLLNKEKVTEIIKILDTNYSHPQSKILLYYASGFNFSEIARMINLARNKVSEIYYEQLNLIKSIVEYEDEEGE